MQFIPEVHLPFSNPVVIFAIVLFIILFSPIILKRFKIPGIVGMIISGIIIGPKGLNLIALDNSIILLGTIGLLYIMFLAGLELNLNEFKTTKYKSLFFAIVLFSISGSLSALVSHYIFNLSWISAMFISILASTFTLLSYPIASRLGLTRHRVMTLAIGAIVFADIAALLLLSVLEQAYVAPDYLISSLLKLGFLSIFFLAFVIYAVPAFAKWFFKNIEEVGTWQFIFVLFILFTTAFLSELAGYEPIIGAFAAGIALNKFIPHTSTLMDRVNFVGNSLFIPFFLIQVGMIIDVRVFTKGYNVLSFGLVLFVIWAIAIITTSYLTTKIFKFPKLEMKFLIGISFSKAAATLAIAVIGHKIGVLDESILNVVIILILLTALISSFLTERFGRQLVTQDEAKVKLTNEFEQKLLVNVANPENISKLIEFGARIRDTHSNHPIYILTVSQDEAELQNKMNHCQKIVYDTVPNISSDLSRKVIVTSRASLNVTDGIIKTIKENLITDVILGFSPNTTVDSRFFGTILQNLLEDTNKSIYVFRSIVPLNLISELFVIIPKHSEYEIGFTKILTSIVNLSTNLNYKVHFYAFQNTILFIQKQFRVNQINIDYKITHIKNDEEFNQINYQIKDENMLICLFSRPRAISYEITYRNIVENYLDKTQNSNFALFYPEQTETYEEQDITHYDILDTSAIQENIVNYNSVKNWLVNLIKKSNQ